MRRLRGTHCVEQAGFKLPETHFKTQRMCTRRYLNREQEHKLELLLPWKDVLCQSQMQISWTTRKKQRIWQHTAAGKLEESAFPSHGRWDSRETGSDFGLESKNVPRLRLAMSFNHSSTMHKRFFSTDMVLKMRYLYKNGYWWNKRLPTVDFCTAYSEKTAYLRRPALDRR